MIPLTVKTTARSQLINIDAPVRKALQEMAARDGVATIFCPHTTAAITINENADPDVCHDLLEDLNRLVPRQQRYYRHAEGNSDAHAKASLVGASEQVLVRDGEMVLGTWQSLYLVEFDGPRTRTVLVGFCKS